MKYQIHTTRKISFESTNGELDLALDDKGFSIRAFKVEHEGAPTALVVSEHLPIHLAMEIRDFLNYALKGYEPVEPAPKATP